MVGSRKWIKGKGIQSLSHSESPKSAFIRLGSKGVEDSSCLKAAHGVQIDIGLDEHDMAWLLVNLISRDKMLPVFDLFVSQAHQLSANNPHNPFIYRHNNQLLSQSQESELTKVLEEALRQTRP